MAKLSGRPTEGVFIAWDVEDVEVERRDAGTVRDRTVVISRKIVTFQALWSNDVTPETIAAAERHIASGAYSDLENYRVQVFGKGERR